MAVTTPWIGSLDPSSFQIGQAGQAIRMRGRNLTGAQVFIDTAEPQPTTVVSDTELTFNVDPGQVTHPRSALIRVLGPDRDVSNPAWVVFHDWPLSQRPGATEPPPPAPMAAGAFDPGDHTVQEVIEYVDANPGEVERVLGLEQAGRNRVTLVEQLQARVA